MARQTSTKRGTYSDARKSSTTRHGTAPIPATRPVAGAFGKERGRPRPRRASGRTVRARRGDILSVNPATGATMATFEALGDSEIGRKIDGAMRAFREYRQTPCVERRRLMQRVAEILDERQREYARLMTMEMGKPITAAVEEVLKCARGCRFYAEHAERMLADEVVETDATRSFVRFRPLGPVLAVMPWNFPFWQVFRFAAPALMAGNVALLKHASNVPQCALAIEDIFTRAGFAPGVFQTLLVSSGQVGSLLDDERIVAATVTGSEGAGSAVASRAGARIKKTVLELGGSDPFIVMPSADLGEAARVAVKARVVNNGQSCIAAKRFIVAQAVADEFERRLVDGMAALRIGDPLDPATELGPLATADILEGLDSQVKRSVKAGARVLTGGRRLDRAGHYYAPTVLTDIPHGSPAHREEMFGPVASLFRARDLDEALAIANDTTFGLGASLWTNDEAERERFIDEIESGLAFVNGMVASDPRLPFGGVKHSGYGRELSVYGLREFVNIKAVWIKEGAGTHGAGTE
jgi:succinate-semialdehyde dehydrogenase / glutarate-semialdehyde dehydrogenase